VDVSMAASQVNVSGWDLVLAMAEAAKRVGVASTAWCRRVFFAALSRLYCRTVRGDVQQLL